MPQEQSLKITQQQGVLNLYDKYAAMLLGYIFEIVKDNELAEQYMVSIFKSISEQYHDILKADNTWCRLQQLAKVKLTDFVKTVKDCDVPASTIIINAQNKLINQMNMEQQNVFCAVYYHGKSINKLAVELNKSELEIRKTLKEAFLIIRKDREHTGVH